MGLQFALGCTRIKPVVFYPVLLWPSLAHRVFLGAMSAFAEQQKDRVERLSQKLYEGLIAGDEGQFLARTGSLLRSNTLRTRSTRDAFHIILQAATDQEASPNDLQKERRFWSKRCVELSLRKMMKDHSLELPILPGFHWNDWYKQQTELVQSLAKKATRNQRGSKAMASPDEMETLEYQVQDRHLYIKSFLIYFTIGKFSFHISEHFQFQIYRVYMNKYF